MYNVIKYICLTMLFSYVHTNSAKHIKITLAVVTGGAKGIGYAIADNYLKNGAKTVIIVDKNRPRGMKAEVELNCIHGANRAVFIHGDITTDLDRVTEKIFKNYGYVDVLVNNAGILKEYDPEQTIKTNALGTVLWTQRFFECMRKDRGGKGGTIMNVASILAYMRDPFMCFYKASKFAVLGLTFGLGHEYNYRTSGVRIFAICPGLTRTDMTLKQQMVVDEQVEIWDRLTQVAQWQSADDVGKAAVILYETANTGMAYTAEGGAPPVVSPDSVNITVEFLDSL